MRIVCTEYSPQDSGNLVGVATLQVAMACGAVLTIHKCPVFLKGAERAVGFPSRSYSVGTEKRYEKVLELQDKTARDAFTENAWEAITRYQQMSGFGTRREA